MDNLKKLIVELRFSKAAPALNIWDDLLRSIAGNGEHKARGFVPQQGAEVKLTDRNALVMIENNRTAISTTKITTKDDLNDFTNNVFQKIISHLKWGDLARIGIRTFWVKKTDHGLSKTIADFKNKFYQTNDLLQSSNDVGVILTLNDDGNRINYSAGPMGEEQLRQQFLSDSQETLPSSCIFVDVDYINLPNQPYNARHFKKNFARALVYAESKAKETFNLFV